MKMAYCNSTRPHNESYFHSLSEITQGCGLRYKVREGLKNVSTKVNGNDGRRRSVEEIFESIKQHFNKVKNSKDTSSPKQGKNNYIRFNGDETKGNGTNINLSHNAQQLVH